MSAWRNVRKTANPTDRRSTLLRLSPKGRRTHGEIVPLARDLEAALTSALDDGERDVMAGALAKLEARVATLH